uniref:Uncharacterized protein n=1 Tax=Anguilla anguilla TaxID=7936 RepID=A0A0E9TEQ3_ANGAN
MQYSGRAQNHLQQLSEKKKTIGRFFDKTKISHLHDRH